MNIQLGNNSCNAVINKGACLNKDGIQLHTCLYGFTETGWQNLVVIKNDKYWLNENTYDSLHDAMKSVTDVFQDWKTFWKTSSNIEVGHLLGN